MPGIAIDNSSIRQISDTVVAQSLVLQFNKVIDQDKGILQMGVKESGSITDLITLKVYEFPMINILWLGVIVMVVGFVMSIIQRYKTLKNKLTIS
jgi:cytochrome c-type biogenesis protein CcmF